MKLIYENKLGKAVFCGGGTGAVRLTAVNGLAFPEREAEVVRYPGEPGQSVTSLSVLPRTITASGDIRRETGREMSILSLVLSQPGSLTVENKRVVRVIGARCVSFIPEKPKGNYIPFTMQMVCDDPYFYDKREQRIRISEKIPKLKSPFVFPCVFSFSKNEGMVLNRGDVPIHPKIELFSASDATCEKGICIRNETNGAALKLTCGIKAGETITIDCENRTVTGTKQGNLLLALSPDTMLSAFLLERGQNRLNVSVPDEPVFITVAAVLRNRYEEAMV